MVIKLVRDFETVFQRTFSVRIIAVVSEVMQDSRGDSHRKSQPRRANIIVGKGSNLSRNRSQPLTWSRIFLASDHAGQEGPTRKRPYYCYLRNMLLFKSEK